MEKNDTCVQCGETKQAIKLHHLFCATVYSTEAGTETDQEWARHRFRPYSEKEIDAMVADEREYIRQMGEMSS